MACKFIVFLHCASIIITDSTLEACGVNVGLYDSPYEISNSKMAFKMFLLPACYIIKLIPHHQCAE